MTTVEQRIAGPERAGGQGLDHHQEESGNRAIVALLNDPVRSDQVDLAMTYRRDAGDGAPLLRGRSRTLAGTKSGRSEA